MLSFFPRGVLDEILNLIELVSEGFPSYSFVKTVANRTAEMSTLRTFFSQYLYLFLTVTDPNQSMQAYRLLGLFPAFNGPLAILLNRHNQ